MERRHISGIKSFRVTNFADARALLTIPAPKLSSRRFQAREGPAQMKKFTFVMMIFRSLSAQTPLSPCDVNSDGSVGVVDVQMAVNQSLGIAACTADIDRDGTCDVIDVQRVVTAALGGGCDTSSGGASSSTGPVIALSSDHKTVTVDYKNGTVRRFARPTFPPETFIASGTTYWVDPSGSDSNPGAQVRPFRTLTKAYNTVRPGDLIYVNPGTYLEHLTITKSGTPSQPII